MSNPAAIPLEALFAGMLEVTCLSFGLRADRLHIHLERARIDEDLSPSRAILLCAIYDSACTLCRYLLFLDPARSPPSVGT